MPRFTTTTLDLNGVSVPAIFQRPSGSAAVPAALVLHGYSSRKERMAETVGAALVRRGLAALSIDLPLHGEREGAMDAQAMRNPIALVGQWRMAMAECGAALAWLAARPDVDPARLALVGYSMGAFLGCEVAARERTVAALVLAAGGDLPRETPFAMLVRTVANPIRAIRKFAGRPLLMIHGRRDTTVRPDQAERLFAAAAEPKRILWYDAGHYLPPRVVDEAVGWLAEQLSVGESRQARA